MAPKQKLKIGKFSKLLKGNNADMSLAYKRIIEKQKQIAPIQCTLCKASPEIANMKVFVDHLLAAHGTDEDRRAMERWSVLSLELNDLVEKAKEQQTRESSFRKKLYESEELNESDYVLQIPVGSPLLPYIHSPDVKVFVKKPSRQSLFTCEAKVNDPKGKEVQLFFVFDLFVKKQDDTRKKHVIEKIGYWKFYVPNKTVNEEFEKSDDATKKLIGEYLGIRVPYKGNVAAKINANTVIDKDYFCPKEPEVPAPGNTNG